MKDLALAYAIKKRMKKKDIDSPQDFLSNEEMSESPLQDLDEDEERENFLSAEMEPLEFPETSDEEELEESGFLPKKSDRKSKLSDAISKRLKLGK